MLLVDEDEVEFVGVELGTVGLQVGAVEEQRIACVHDLHDDVTALDHSPQLAPELDVLLVGRHCQALCLLRT